MVTVMTCAMLVLATLMVVIVVVVEAIMGLAVGTLAIRMVLNGAT